MMLSISIVSLSMLTTLGFAAWNFRLRKLRAETCKTLGRLEQHVAMLRQNNSQPDGVFNQLANHLPGGLFQCRTDRSGHVSWDYLSPVLYAMLEHEPGSQLKSKHWLAKVHPDDQTSVDSAFFASIHSGHPVDHDFRLIRNDGSYIWTNIAASSEKQEDGTLVWHGFLTDINNRKSTESQYEKMALYDPLTDIPNRRFFFHRLNQIIASSSRKGQQSALLYMDLDDFKALNDERGHDVGDELLRQVAKRLNSITRQNDTVARLGGDEFVLLLEDMGIDEDMAIRQASAVAEKILREFGVDFNLPEGPHNISPSIGVCVFGGAETNAQELINRADSAMYLAKKAGSNTYVIYNDELNDLSSGTSNLVREFRKAVDEDELCLHFQPQIDRDGRIVGAEALVRWEHPVRGILLPSQFLPAAERGGLMNRLNNWVLEMACRKLATWKQDPRTQHLVLSINMDEHKFGSSALADDLKELFAKYPFEREKLTIEVTEKSLSRRPEAMAEKMRKLKETGIRISMDDFGTGRSSLTQLNLFPLDEIKIDGKFISRMEDEKSYISLIEGILGMARALQLDTVAEHVSSTRHEEFLRNRGCNRFQGYYYYPPVDEAELMNVLSEQDEISAPFRPQLAAV